jgi:hypothetical protein
MVLEHCLDVRKMFKLTSEKFIGKAKRFLTVELKKLF